MNTSFRPVVAIAALGMIAGALSAPARADLILPASYAHPVSVRGALLNDVGQIAAPGLPGSLSVFGKDAIPVVAGRAGEKYREPVVAAGYLGRGRVVAFGHTGYLSGDPPTPANPRRSVLSLVSARRLPINAVYWTSVGKARARVALVGEDVAGMRADLELWGFVVSVLSPNEASRFRDFDVLVAVFSGLPPATRNAAAAFARAGGGLIGAETGWGWRQLNPGKTLAENGGNQIFAAAGIVWTEGTLERTSEDGFTARDEDLSALNASVALDGLLSGKLAPDESAAAVWTVSRAAQSLPENDRALLPRLRDLEKQHATDFSDLAKNPVTMDRPLDRLVMTLQVRAAMTLPPEKIKAAPSAVSFPGAVPANAPRAEKTVDVDTSVPGWHGTGVYAAPGERLTVVVPAGAVGKGLRVRIGAHTDALWHLPRWQRAPEITRSFPLDAATVSAANAFGGTVFIEAPRDGRLGTISVRISGGVAQPRFVRGVTGAAEWKEIRRAPAPWAELEGQRVALSVPSEAVRDLDDPAALMAYWDEVIARSEKLYAAPARVRPERYTVDRQISAGYMHSGYPIMTGDDVGRRFTDLGVLRGPEGNRVWGFYHELGHNYQERDWTFDGTGEVTNNLFSLYGCETINGATLDGVGYKNAHPAVAPGAVEERLRKYLDAGAKYETWKSDPFLALSMYIQLRRAFGWEPFTTVFAEYRKLSESERPKTDAERRDQWMVRFSRAVGRNLGPFFQTWGVPTSPSARASIADLPSWMPDEMTGTKTEAAVPAAIRGRNYQRIKNWDFGATVTTRARLDEEFYTRYIYNDGRLDFLNDEWERYRDNDNHVLDGHTLKLTARIAEGLKSGGVESGMLRSKWTGKYGYYECRMKVPRGRGMWPAFWINPQVGWPPEIDVVEIVNNGRDTTANSFHFVHEGKEKPQDIETKLDQWGSYRPGADYADDFHTFAVLWTPERVDHYVDGVLVVSRRFLWQHKDGSDGGPAHVLVNLAVGGNWPGPPDNPRDFPAALEIQYIRVWQAR